MKLNASALAIALVVSLATSVRAERWCADGPHHAPDRPCSYYEDIAANALDRMFDEWSKTDGVESLGAGLSCSGDYAEITLHVSPRYFFSSSPPIPEFVDGVAVRIEAELREWSPDPSPPPGASQSDRNLYARVVAGHGKQWSQIPGVVQFGWFGCTADVGCGIGVIVQSRMMQSVRDRIPASIDGERITLIPIGWFC